MSLIGNSSCRYTINLFINDPAVLALVSEEQKLCEDVANTLNVERKNKLKELFELIPRLKACVYKWDSSSVKNFNEVVELAKRIPKLIPHETNNFSDIIIRKQFAKNMTGVVLNEIGECNKLNCVDIKNRKAIITELFKNVPEFKLYIPKKWDFENVEVRLQPQFPPKFNTVYVPSKLEFGIGVVETSTTLPTRGKYTK